MRGMIWGTKSGNGSVGIIDGTGVTAGWEKMDGTSYCHALCKDECMTGDVWCFEGVI
jgi:hypothetical protein